MVASWSPSKEMPSMLRFILFLILVSATNSFAATVIGSVKFTSYSTNRQVEINSKLAITGTAADSAKLGGTAAATVVAGAAAGATALQGNQTITLSGYATGSGATSIITTVTKVQGTATASNAAAGDVGEFVESSALNVSVATRGTPTEVTSITLDAGDWDISGVINYFGSQITNKFFVMGISANSGSFAGATRGKDYVWAASDFVDSIGTAAIPRLRVSIAGRIPYYLNAGMSSIADTCDGYISARRVR